MQMRPYDTEEQGIDRVIRSILSWDACQFAARGLDISELQTAMLERKTALAEDVMRNAVVTAQQYFNEIYNG
jgi:xylose isomerase